MRYALVVVLAALAGCDAVSDSAPSWTEAGAVATFDYTPGPDSLSVLGPGQTPPSRRAPATLRAVEMRVVRATDPAAYTDLQVAWNDPGAPNARSRFSGEARLPLEGDDVSVAGDGLRVTVAHDCPDIGLRRSAGAGPLTFVRVPREAGAALDVWGDCTRSPLYYRAVRTEQITVPAGTFEAVVIEGPAHPDGQGPLGVEWWSWEIGLVRYDKLRYDGMLQGRFERSAGG